MKSFARLLAAGLALFLCSGAFAAENGPIPQYIEGAIADAARPEADRKRDLAQKPAEVLVLSGVKPGDRVADFWPVPPYSTRLLSKVVGPAGRVYAVLPEKLVREVPQAETDVRKWLADYHNTTLLMWNPLALCWKRRARCLRIQTIHIRRASSILRSEREPIVSCSGSGNLGDAGCSP